MRRSSTRWSTQMWRSVTTAILLGAILGSASASATRTGPAKRSTTADSKVTSAATKPVRQRLPAYFSKVVTAKQRQQIYVIQAGYRKQVERLQEQLSQLLRQRDQEVDLVLSPDQLQQVQTLRAAAAARRKHRRSAQVDPQKRSPKPPAKENP